MHRVLGDASYRAVRRLIEHIGKIRKISGSLSRQNTEFSVGAGLSASSKVLGIIFRRIRLRTFSIKSAASIRETIREVRT